MLRFKMKATDEFEKLVPFFIENGLEYSEGETEPDGLVQCWEVVHGDEDDEHLTAALVLTRKQGEYVIDAIAVSKLFRKLKIGKILMEKAIKEVLEKGGRCIYLVAKVPEFFKKFGFKEISREEAPDFSGCFDCEQYGISCSPAVMKLDFE